MRKSVFRFLLIIIGAGMFLGSSTFLWAQPPDIHIDLSFDKTTYIYGEPVRVEVTVTNDTGKDILINQGFSSLDYYLEMRVIDPGERLLVVKRDEVHDEFPDAPPLGYIIHEGRLIQVADCEELAVGWMRQSQTQDLRTHYDLDLPGNYSAQVQLSAMIFKGSIGDPCDVNDYEWLGVLKSETEYFKLQGNTEGVRVIPNQWKLSWKEEENKISNVQVHIMAEDEKELDGYDPASFRLNNLEAVSVRILPPMLKVYFNARELMENLGNVEIGKWYWVMISGKLKNGQYFAREQQIRVVR